MEQSRQIPIQQPRSAEETGPGNGSRYVVLIASYVGLWVVFLVLMWAVGRPWPDHIGMVDLLLLSLAVFRLTEIVSEEKVARALRAPFCDMVTHTSAEGLVEEEEVPAGTGLRRCAGEMLLCPWCAGVWIATFVAFFWLLLPGIATIFLLVFAIAAGGLLFQIFAKLMDRTRKSIGD